MQHLDEGTIHAWLDGALDATQSSEIESHIAQCATCSAAVAEARGLVAGASRILNALDDVPANVVPKRAPSAPRQRQWRAAPWVTGIAAALLLAIGISTMDRQDAAQLLVSGKEPVAAPTASLADSARSLTAPAPVGGSAKVSSALSAPSIPSTPSAPPATPRVAAADESRDRARSERRIAIAEDMRRSDSASPQSAMNDAGATKLRAAAGAGAEVARRATAQQKLEEVVVTSAPAAAPTKSAVSPEELKKNVSPEVERLAGCYRIASDTKGLALDAAAPKAAVAGGRVARAQAADRPAAANYATAPAPNVVRLDTLLKPFGYVVRAEQPDTTIIGSWSRFGPDTVQVRLLSGIALTVTGKNRVSCPER